MRDLPTHANFEPALCFGLFRSIKRGARRQALTHEWPTPGQPSAGSRAASFAFRSDVSLGADDMRVLQGVLAFARREPLKIGAAKGGELGKLRTRLKLSGVAGDGDALLVTLGYAELARAVGYGSRNQRDLHGGGLTKKVQVSLDRLAGLSVSWRRGGASGSWQLLAWDDRGARDAKLRIALNPHTGGCALGQPPFARIDLVIARSLLGDPARLMHLRVSAWMGRSTEARDVSLERLADYPWSPGKTGPSGLRKRRWAVNNVIEELKAAGWQIDAVEGRPSLRRISPGKPSSGDTEEGRCPIGSSARNERPPEKPGEPSNLPGRGGGRTAAGG